MRPPPARRVGIPIDRRANEGVGEDDRARPELDQTSGLCFVERLRADLLGLQGGDNRHQIGRVGGSRDQQRLPRRLRKRMDTAEERPLDAASDGQQTVVLRRSPACASAAGISSNARGLPRLSSSTRSARSGGSSSIVCASKASAASRWSPSSRSSGSSGASKTRVSPSRAAIRTTTGSSATRLQTKRRASAVATSSHCASSTRHRSACSVGDLVEQTKRRGIDGEPVHALGLDKGERAMRSASA